MGFHGKQGDGREHRHAAGRRLAGQGMHCTDSRPHMRQRFVAPLPTAVQPAQAAHSCRRERTKRRAG
jgi:hypothetical protein